MAQREYPLSEQEKLERIREMLDDSQEGQLKRIKTVLGPTKRRYAESEQEKLTRNFRETKRSIDANMATLKVFSSQIRSLERKFDVELEARKRHRQLARQTLEKLNKYIDNWL